MWTSESKAFVLVRDQEQMGLVTATVVGATVGLWRATPPVIPQKMTSPGPALAENWSHVDNFFMRMSGKKCLANILSLREVNIDYPIHRVGVSQEGELAGQQ